MGYGGWQHVILPAVSIAFMSLAINARLLRASMLDVAGQRHVTWARLRGLNDKQTERRHILRNASLPMITAVGMHIGELDWRHGGYRKHLCLARRRPLCGVRPFLTATIR